MRREEVRELHYITPVENVRSILIRGIYCYHRAQALGADSFAKKEVQARREGKSVPDGLPLHDYVNLYFRADNATLSSARDQHGDLCVLRVDPTVLDSNGVFVSDRNAASDDAKFAPAAEGLAHLNRRLVFAESWNIGGPLERSRHDRKQMASAEVLVPDRVPGAKVNGAYVSCRESEGRLRRLVPESHFTVDRHPRLFFLRSDEWGK